MAISILFFEWFYNHPSLRYGGYVLVFSLIFLPLIVKLKSYKLKKKSIKSKFITLIICIFIIFIFRNTLRLHKEYTNYNYNFFKDFKYNVEKSYFRINEKININLTNKRFIRK